MATKAEVRNRAANDLGLLRLNQDLQAQDVTRIESGYDEIYAQLKKEGLATWATTAEVPDELVPHVVALVADNCLSTYGVSVERFNRIKTSSIPAMREIRRLNAPHYPSQDEPTDY
jgi:hypothetical protein